ncbi:hypothetical protein [Embleya sp. NPDC005971]|uniref:hypothetical protein n=1 Tax=Embleya sp. NPDC005971 TaxID=3156724 RepID=UPI0033D3D4A6
MMAGEVPRRLGPRGAYLLATAAGLAYYAGQIIVDPRYSTTRGLTPVSDLVPLDVLGWAWMACAVLGAAFAVGRVWRPDLDRFGFAAATFPPVMWWSAFMWSWLDTGRQGYPSGGTWLCWAAGLTIVNVYLDRLPQGARKGHIDA